MRMIGRDFRAAQQTIAMLACASGEVVEQVLRHEGDAVREFYAALPRPVVVGIEATGSMGWFLRLLADLDITCRVGHPAAIRRAETPRQKHDRRDAALLLELLTQDRSPAIWLPSPELWDLRALLLHRHQGVRLRTRVMNALQGLALGQGIRRRAGHRGVPRRPIPVCRRQGRSEPRRVDPERVLERRSAAARSHHQARQSVPPAALVRGGDPRGPTRPGVTALLSAETRAERSREGSRRGRAQAGHPPLNPAARSDRLRRVLSPCTGARDGAVRLACGDACVENSIGST